MEPCPECGTEMRFNCELSYDFKGNYYYCPKCNTSYEMPIRCLNVEDDL